MAGSRLKICLVCSGGGHLRQILQLESLRDDFDCYLVTGRTVLAESASKTIRTFYVEDIALGMLRTGPKAWLQWIRNFFQSLAILRRERPDVILSTGAGTALNTLVLGRLFGKRVLFIETFAHTRTPSLTGKWVARFAHGHLVQWEALVGKYPKAMFASPLIETGEVISTKKEAWFQVLVTVGTHGPFDRLVMEVERLIEEKKIRGRVAAQVGTGGYAPSNMETVATCTPEEMKGLQEDSEIVITHAGTGSILSALEAGCKVIAIPRSAWHGEHYDDHQIEILSEMRSRDAILGGFDPSDLEELLEKVGAFEPRKIEISVEPIDAAVRELLGEWFPK